MFYLAAIVLAVQLATAHHYGYFRDELYYLACSEHLAWGYVDQPPLIAFIAWLARAIFGDSLPAIRFLPASVGATLVVLTGKLVRELGGRRFAQGLAALAVTLAPINLSIDHLLTMNAFEPLFWMGCAFVLIRMIKTGNTKLWVWFGLLSGLGLENKHSMLFFGFGAVVGLLLTPERRLLRSRWLWLGALVALLIFLPNLAWEIRHHFPTLELLQNVQQSGRNVSLNALGFLLQQILIMHPLAFPIWMAGLWYYLRTQEGKPYRALGWTYLIILAVMLVLNGRIYYLAPAYSMLFAAGAVAIDNWLERRQLAVNIHRQGNGWLKGAYATLLVATGLMFAPFSMPVLPVETYIAYSKALHFSPPRIERHRLSNLPQIYADMFGWKEMTETVAKIYNSLPPEERARTALFGNNYGEAGAIDFFGPRYGLPKAISGHQNYFYWGPRDYTGEIMIVLGEGDPRNLERGFASVQPVAAINNEYAMPYENLPIYLCRGPKFNVKEMWPRLKKWN